jgi:hypothetical protein
LNPASILIESGLSLKGKQGNHPSLDFVQTLGHIFWLLFDGANGCPQVLSVYHLTDRKHAALSLTDTTADANIR